MRIAIVTDAWRPQVNGVVTTYEATRAELEAMGHRVLLITPEAFRTVPCPTYPSIRLAVLPGRGVARALEGFAADAIHVATEGPLGLAAHRWCRQQGRPFTTAFHTQFPEYLRLRAPVPLAWSYAWIRRFHAAAVRTLVPTQDQRERLRARGFEHLVLWPRGVDTTLFRPATAPHGGMERPILVYLGRVAVEKNIAAFLELQTPGTKLVIGDGPDRPALQARYPKAVFAGQKLGAELAALLAGGDVMVFPSRTDTFGIVMLEAMACGLPVAAYPVTGPVDVVADGVTGALDEDLAAAVARALTLDPAACVAQAAEHSWRRCTETFLAQLAVAAA